MDGRCCVFVDGENLRHSLIELFHDVFNKNDYLPKTANWESLFDWLVSEVSPDLQRIRTYWYVVEHLDFHPYSPFPKEKQGKFKMLRRHRPYKEELSQLSGKEYDDRVDAILAELTEKRSRIRNRFDGWRKVQDGIISKHNAVEFRRAGAIKYNLFEGTFGDEKAVDVKLATDLIVLRDIYDVALIVSGDQDYVPAVQYVKDSGKRVINVAFKTHNGRPLPGGARRLGQETDSALQVAYHDLRSHLNL